MHAATCNNSALWGAMSSCSGPAVTSGIEQRLNVIVQPHHLLPTYCTYCNPEPAIYVGRAPCAVLPFKPQPFSRKDLAQTDTLQIWIIQLNTSIYNISKGRVIPHIEGLNENICREIRFQFQFVCSALSVCHCKRNATNVYITGCCSI